MSQHPPRRDFDTCELVTCGRCASDFCVMPAHGSAARYRCHCGRAFFLAQTAEGRNDRTAGMQCVTPEDNRAWIEGRGGVKSLDKRRAGEDRLAAFRGAG